MSAQAQPETFQCSGCHKRFFADGFKVDRLGRRLKTCLECNVRAKVNREAQKCEHGHPKSMCQQCGGQSLCAHGRARCRCQTCGGASFCEHHKLRHRCLECGGAGVCCHGRRMDKPCHECPVGAPREMAPNAGLPKGPRPEALADRSANKTPAICPHGRKNRWQCKECEPDSYRKMTTLRDFHRFQKLDSWPANLVEYSQRHAYDLCVAKWTARFAEVLASGRVTPEEHAAVMSKLAPWTGPLAQ